MAIKVAKVEVWRIDGDHKATRERWHDLAEQVQQITNCIWETWLCWHVANKSAVEQRRFLDEFAEWKKTKEGDKPKCGITAIPKVLDKLIYDTLAQEFPHVNTTTRELVRNAVTSKLKTKKAANGSLPGWVAIILRNESIPSSTRSQPIPFSKRNAKIILPSKSGDRFAMELRIDRVPVKGKKASGGHVDRIELLTNRRGIRKYEDVFYKIAKGEYDFCGSSLQWNRDLKKWFVLICYRVPDAEAVSIDVNSAATLCPGRNDPWALWQGGSWTWFGGTGRNVTAVRERVLKQRWSRQENYRHAGTSTKGHGTNRALKAVEQLTQSWKAFTKNSNHQTTTKVVQHCVRNGIGTLIYLQPLGGRKRFLETTGKVEGRRDSTGWDWFQVGAMLSYKCQQAGIKLDIRKCQRQEKSTVSARSA